MVGQTQRASFYTHAHTIANEQDWADVHNFIISVHDYLSPRKPLTLWGFLHTRLWQRLPMAEDQQL